MIIFEIAAVCPYKQAVGFDKTYGFHNRLYLDEKNYIILSLPPVTIKLGLLIKSNAFTPNGTSIRRIVFRSTSPSINDVLLTEEQVINAFISSEYRTCKTQSE